MTKAQKRIYEWIQAHDGMNYRITMYPDTSCHYLVTYDNGDTYESITVDGPINWHTKIKINGETWQE